MTNKKEKEDLMDNSEKLIKELFEAVGSAHQRGMQLPEIVSGLLHFAVDLSYRASPSKSTSSECIEMVIDSVSEEYDDNHYKDNENLVDVLLKLESMFPSALSESIDKVMRSVGEA